MPAVSPTGGSAERVCLHLVASLGGIPRRHTRAAGGSGTLPQKEEEKRSVSGGCCTEEVSQMRQRFHPGSGSDGCRRFTRCAHTAAATSPTFTYQPTPIQPLAPQTPSPDSAMTGAGAGVDLASMFGELKQN